MGWIGIVVQVLLVMSMMRMGEPGVIMWIPIMIVAVVTIPILLAGVVMGTTRKLCLAGLAFYVIVIGGFFVMSWLYH